MSYLISAQGDLLAKVENRKAGDVRYSTQRVEERIDANRGWNLVNAEWGKVSNAKKWDEKYRKMPAESLWSAQEIAPGEYFIER